MRFLKIDYNNIIDIQTKSLLRCPLAMSSINHCNTNCLYFKKEKDKTADVINIYCKDFFVGILSKNEDEEK